MHDVPVQKVASVVTPPPSMVVTLFEDVAWFCDAANHIVVDIAIPFGPSPEIATFWASLLGFPVFSF